MPNYNALFLSQSYIDSYADYEASLIGAEHPRWDYVVLTASNESQAMAFRAQLDYRLKNGKLPSRTHYAVLPDPDGKRVGSGGATLNVIKYIAAREESFTGLKILVIHSGGDSKRVPQYSACGKLFSPVPRLLPDGRRSTLFDEFIIGMTGVPSRINDGMLVCSGDVLLLFNPLQIDFYSKGAAAISIKEGVETGKDHGVYLRDENGDVGRFLHKQTVATLSDAGAVDANGNVDIDTGAVILDSNILNDLSSLIDSDAKFAAMVNEKVRLSFYADFLYPLASGSTLESFYKETPEGDFSDELTDCRKLLWEALHKYRMKLLRFSPASFIHFGTTRELLSLVTDEIETYRFLDWSELVNTNKKDNSFAVSNSYISPSAVIGKGSYIEDSYIHKGAVIGSRCVISGITADNVTIPDGTVLHGLKLSDGRFTVRMYGVNDNPKENRLFGRDIGEPLWTAKLYPVCDTVEEALQCTVNHIPASEYTSLRDSFNNADVLAVLPWQAKLDDYIKAESFLEAIERRAWVTEAIKVFNGKLSIRVVKQLLKTAGSLDIHKPEEFGKKIRIYFYLSKLLTGEEKQGMLDRCFGTICDTILESALEGTAYNESYRIAKPEVITRLPVRVNWGGGWSDTPPYCMEHGGTVLNAAVTLSGQYPIEVTVRRINDSKIILASTDIGSYKEFDDIAELQACRNPGDAFALHKAALIACGVIPYKDSISVKDITDRLGGGLYMNTRVINIPKGSGLGTSSILSGACVKGLYEFLGVEISENDLYNRVLCMEQLMSTGGGWQDQVGGLAKGIKMVTSEVGLKQELKCEPVKLSDKTLKELDSRFCLIYTGQRRLARNLLREVVGKYIGSDPAALEVLYEIQRMAVLMRFELEKGNIEGFAELMNEHWELSRKLDAGCTNTCINQMFITVDDLICGKMICGAGGGGFLQVILKKNVTADMLRERLKSVFADSGVDVWQCGFDI